MTSSSAARHSAEATPIARSRPNTPFRRTLVYLLARTRGGRNRCRILRLIQGNGPQNANQIACSLGLHYTTVQHHLACLARDNVVAASPRGDSYGALFYLTYQMERDAEFLEEIFPNFEGSDRPGLVDLARGTNRGAALP